MAKVNTRFVLIGSVVALSAISIILLAIFLVRRGDATRHIVAGDEHVAIAEQYLEDGNHEAAQNELSKALERYGRALDKEKSNREYFDLYQQTLASIVPATEQEAIERHERWLSARYHESLYWPNDPESHLRQIRELYELARLTRHPEHWSLVSEAGEAMWEALDDDQPERILGRMYMGIAAMASMRVSSEESVTDTDVGEEILDEVIEADPDNDHAYGMKIDIRFARASAFERANKGREAAQQLAELDELLERATPGGVPIGPRVALGKARRMMMLQRNGEAAYSDAEMEALAQQIETLTRAEIEEDPMLLLDASGMLGRMPVDRAGERAASLLSEYVDEHPDAVAHMFWLARQYLTYGAYDESEAMSRRIVEMDPLPVGLESRMLWRLQPEAASLIVEGLQYRWQEAPEDQRDELLARIVEARDKLAELVQGDEENILLLRADARLLFARGKHRASNEKFNQLIRLTGGSNADDLYQSAIVLRVMGETGAALQRVNAALEREQRDLRFLTLKAQLQADLRQYRAAEMTVQQIFNIDPDNEPAQQLRLNLVELRQIEEGGDPVVEVIRAAERATYDGDFETAIQMLEPLQAAHGDDFRLLMALVIAHRLAGNRESALEYLAAAEAINPDSPTLRRNKLLLGEDDPVEVQKQYIAGLDIGETEKLVRMVAAMDGVSRRHESTARAKEAAGDLDGAAADRDIAERARREHETAKAEVERIAPEHPDYLAYQYDVACSEENWAEAERIVGIATRTNADQSGGLLYRGDLLVRQEKFSEAVDTLEQATRRSGTSVAWLRLGEAHEGLGDYDKALAAYQTAYTRKPDDRRTVHAYTDLLVRMGRHNEAITYLQDAVKQLPNDRELRSRWLTLEAQVGDLWTVLTERMRIRQVDPGNYENALRLAEILTTRTPSWRTISAPNGAPKYTLSTWRELTSEQQVAEVERARQEWAGITRVIIDDLIEAGGDRRLDVRSLQAFFLLQQDQAEEGEQVLRDFIATSERPVDKLGGTLKLCEYLGFTNRSAEAIALLEESRSLQTDRLEIDEAIGTMYRTLDQPEQAIAQYDKVAAATERPDLEGAVIQLLLMLNRTDEARDRLAAHKARHGETYRSAMLEALTNQVEGNELHALGSRDEALDRFAEQRNHLTQAASRNRATATPHVELAKSYVASYRIDRDTSHLQQALTALDQADERNASNPESAIFRADIQQELGNRDGAIAALQDRLALIPTNEAVRTRLIELYMEQGNLSAAIDQTRDGIALDPMSATWHDGLGDLYVLRGQFGAAAQEFYRAYLIEPSTRTLAKYAEARMNESPPAYTKVIEALANEEASLHENPLLRGLYAQALAGAQRGGDALRQMHRAYDRHREIIAENPEEAASITGWYIRLNSIFTPRQIENNELDAFVEEVRDGEPDMYELQAMARIWLGVGPSGYPKAIELQRKAVEACPDDQVDAKIEAIRFLGYFQMQTEDFTGAMNSFQRILEIDPDMAEANNNVAYILAEELNRFDEALPLAEKAVSLAPDDANTRDTLGWIYYRLARYDDAEMQLLEGYRRHRTAVLAYHLGEVYRAKQDSAMARQYLTEAKELAEADSNAELLEEIQAALDDIRTR